MQTKSDVDLSKFTPTELCQIFRTAWRYGELRAMKTLIEEFESRSSSDLSDIADEVSFFRGLIAKYENRLVDAMAAFTVSLNLNPKRHDSAIELARLKCYHFDFEGAYRLINECQGDFSKSPVYLNMAGECLVTLGLPERALSCFEQAKQLQPEIHDFTMNLASCLAYTGRSSEAITLLEELLNGQGEYPVRALYQMSSVAPEKLGPFLAKLPSSDPPGLPATIRAMRLHAEARFADTTGDGERAWSLREKAGELVNETVGNAPTDEAKLVSDAISVSSTTDWTTIPDAPIAEDDTTLIFVLGLPRSGTTLVEQILTSHPEVASVGETNLIARSILKATGRNAPSDRLTGDVLSEVLLSHPQAIRQNYLANTRHLSQGSRYTVEKQPINTVFFPILLKAFPDAHFIFTERDAMATAYSMFKQLFSQAYFSSNRLVDLNVYLKAHRSMMDAWRKQFPERIVEVRYEALVSEPQLAIRALLESLSLADHPNVYEHHLHFTRSMTASSQQVQNAIHDVANEAWKEHQGKLVAELSL